MSQRAIDVLLNRIAYAEMFGQGDPAEFLTNQLRLCIDEIKDSKSCNQQRLAVGEGIHNRPLSNLSIVEIDRALTVGFGFVRNFHIEYLIGNLDAIWFTYAPDGTHLLYASVCKRNMDILSIGVVGKEESTQRSVVLDEVGEDFSLADWVAYYKAGLEATFIEHPLTGVTYSNTQPKRHIDGPRLNINFKSLIGGLTDTPSSLGGSETSSISVE